MYNSVGRDVAIGLLGLFGFMALIALYVLYYSFVIAFGLCWLAGLGIRRLYRRHQQKKLGTQQMAEPMPVMSRVGPRDWTPPQ